MKLVPILGNAIFSGESVYPAGYSDATFGNYGSSLFWQSGKIFGLSSREPSMNKKTVFFESIIHGIFAFCIIFCCASIIKSHTAHNLIASSLLLILAAFISSTLATSFNLFFIKGSKHFFNKKHFLIMNFVFVLAAIALLPFIKDKYLLLFLLLFVNALFFVRYIYLHFKSAHT